jgi:hypothetical protein
MIEAPTTARVARQAIAVLLKECPSIVLVAPIRLAAAVASQYFSR